MRGSERGVPGAVSDRSKWLFKEDFTGIGAPALDPTGLAIMLLGAGAGPGHQLGDRMPGVTQAGAGVLEEGAADAASFMIRRDEQGPHPAVARVARGEPVDRAVIVLPDPERVVVDVPGSVLLGHRVRVGQPVLGDAVADLEDARDIRPERRPDHLSDRASR